jgi:hypothetical protein
MAHSLLILHCMSGTGNTYRVAQWIAQAGRNAGATVQLNLIGTSVAIPAAKPLDSQSLLGVLMPTHGFTAPWPVILRAISLPHAHGAHAFVVATRGGTKLGPLNFPGLEGTIEAGHSWAVLVYYTTALVPAAFITMIINPLLPHGVTTNRFVAAGLSYVISLASLFAAYRLFAFALRIPIINRVFTLTTFTHLYRRYHEPATSLTDLSRPTQPR